MSAKQFKDDTYTTGLDDVSKMRRRSMMYISYSGDKAAKAIVLEILFNAVDENINSRSPADRIDITFDEANDRMTIADNGRGIPTDILETILTTLNSGSNIDSSDKNDNVLGTNGVGTIAFTALGAETEVYSYRGGSENKCRHMLFREGVKILDETKKCSPDKHGLQVSYVPSKIVLGKKTRIIWDDVNKEIRNLQFLLQKKIKISSKYIKANGEVVDEKYVVQPFENILNRNNKQDIITDKIKISIEDNNITEETGGKDLTKSLSMDIAFTFANTTTPYIDSFCNGNNTIDNGSHLDGAIEALCRYFQQVTKNSLTERDRLDIKWDDVRANLSIVVNLNTTMKQIFTSQTKHKITNDTIDKTVKSLMAIELNTYFENNPNQLKDIINVVKLNARIRREGEKVKNSVVKETLTNWSSYKITGFDPCIAKGKEYKELFIIEGDSAKGSLKPVRDPKFQALYAIRGVSANVWKLDLDGVLKNAEFNNLIKILGCNIGSKFDMSKLNYDKIIICSDADVDGLGIRSLLCSFFIKIYPEIVTGGHLYIAEPPLYRVDSATDPFVINKEDYSERFINNMTKEYSIKLSTQDNFMNKSDLYEFLYDTNNYVSDTHLMAEHYEINDGLMELINREIAFANGLMDNFNVNRLMIEVRNKFPEMDYHEDDKLIIGVIDAKPQLIELTDRLPKKAKSITSIINKYGTIDLTLKHIKTTGSEHELTFLNALKILDKFKPVIKKRFKGLAENDSKDLKITSIDPNTRTLIQLTSSDIENDIKVFNKLRGTSPEDRYARSQMMREFIIAADLIDT